MSTAVSLSCCGPVALAASRLQVEWHCCDSLSACADVRTPGQSGNDVRGSQTIGQLRLRVRGVGDDIDDQGRIGKFILECVAGLKGALSVESVHFFNCS